MAAWFLAPFTLPLTFWAATSPAGLSYNAVQIALKQTPLFCGVAMSGMMVATLNLYRRFTCGDPAKWSVLALASVFSGLFIVSFIVAGTAVSSQAVTVLFPLLCGLIATRILRMLTLVAPLLGLLVVCQEPIHGAPGAQIDILIQ